MKRPALFARLASVRPEASLRRQPRAKPVGCEAVCTNAGCALERAAGTFFSSFYDSAVDEFAARLARPCQKFRKGPACGNKTRPKRHLKRENAMDHALECPSERPSDRPPTSAPLRALDNAFHAQFDASRADPLPGLVEVRIDRLRRLRAAVEENEGRFEQAISADFGHRAAIETTIAETAVPLCRDQARHQTSEEMDGAAAHPHRAAIHARARNRLIPQPLGVVGIIAPWNYPLQLTLAPAIGRDRRRQPGDDQAGRADAAFLRALEGSDRAKIRCHRKLLVTGYRGRGGESVPDTALRSSDLHRLDARWAASSRRPRRRSSRR